MRLPRALRLLRRGLCRRQGQGLWSSGPWRKTSTRPPATGKLQFSMVLAFSEWWRNSIRDRSVAGQARARTEGRFPGRRPSLSEQQREYIWVERSKGGEPAGTSQAPGGQPLDR